MTGISAGVGRPRHAPQLRAGVTGREQILDAAAQMFSEQGYGAASTRKIAEAVGVKQASLYYHFASKQDILANLLAGTVRPSLAYATRLARTGEPPHVQLYALTYFDVGLLSSGRWNSGALYTLPEVRGELFEEFHRERRLLKRAYGRRIVDGLRAATFEASSPDLATSLAFALAESVISMRADGTALLPGLPDLIATSVLRLLACTERDLTRAAHERPRLESLAPEIER